MRITHPLVVDDDVLEAAHEKVGAVRERGEGGAGGAQARHGERRHRRVVRLVLADRVDGLLLVRRQHQVRRVYRHEHLRGANDGTLRSDLTRPRRAADGRRLKLPDDRDASPSASWNRSSWSR